MLALALALCLSRSRINASQPKIVRGQTHSKGR